MNEWLGVGWLIKKDHLKKPNLSIISKVGKGKKNFNYRRQMRDWNGKKRTELEVGGERTIRRGKKHQIWVKYQKVGDGSLGKFNYRWPIRDQKWKKTSELEWVHKDWHQKWKKRSEWRKGIRSFLGKEFAALLKFTKPQQLWKSQKMIDRVMQILTVSFAVVVSSQFVWFVGSSFLLFFWEP